jgi:formylglycine-generating enzyme required for sulfatase activity/dienelactone hydrolase
MKDDQLLDSWKEIAEYLGRTRKTCLRWEKEFDLPIHRFDGTPKARVFAYKEELDRWLEETLKGKEQPSKILLFTFIREKFLSPSIKFVIPILGIFLAFIAVSIWYLNRQSKIRWAREVAIPEVERLASEDNYDTAYQIALEASKYISDNQSLNELLPIVTGTISIETSPAGADVYIKDYAAEDEEWLHLGQTPLRKAETSRGYKQWKVIKPGYETVEGSIYLSEKYPWELSIKLDPEGAIPCDMVHINAISYSIPNGSFPTINRDYPYNPKLNGLKHLKPVPIGEYLIDKYEVTNRQYKEFLDSGGYRKKEYWNHEFRKDGLTLTWEEAMKEFVDSTGRPGPSTWALGDYPDGKDDYPVCGVSWYEAAAYAEFVGKKLPTVYHWNFATGIIDNYYGIGFLEAGYIIPHGNFRGKGPSRVGEFKGLSPHGLYDMPGNVKEWCWNSIENRRISLSGGWDEPEYMFRNADHFPPFLRAHNFGFRCMKYLSEENVDREMSKPVEADSIAINIKEPCSDEIFEIYKSLYDYAETELDPIVESREEWSSYSLCEKVSFNAAYGDERMIAYLFFPRNGKAPFQTVIYWPGEGGYNTSSIEDYETRDKFEWLARHDRAVVLPVYYGTFERPNKIYGNVTVAVKREEAVKEMKDLRRTLDYLETREEIDLDKIAIYGLSSGARWCSVVPAIEERIKATIVMGGGFDDWFNPSLPEWSQFNTTPRVKIPVLMLCGKYDYLNPLEISYKPLFRLFGTADNDKHLKIYDTGHALWDTNAWKRDMLDFLDKYFGEPNQD